MADRTSCFNPKDGVLSSLGMTKSEFEQAVFQDYSQHKKRDCHESIHALPVVLKGWLYLLEDVADIRMYGETFAERSAREKADNAAWNAQRQP